MPTKQNTAPNPAEIARMAAIVERLREVYPDAVCALEWGGQYGGNREAEPPVIPFDGDTERVLTEEWGEREPTVYGVE